jgi:soluble lytic murein transglycosylase-like protein
VWKRLVLYVCAATATITAVGSGVAFAAEPSAQVSACLAAAARKYGIHIALLHAIAEQESGFNPNVIGRANRDGTVDYGLMQINSAWLSTLGRYGIGKDSLLDPCVNAEVGAWILADNIQRLGLTWNAIGAYNATSAEKRLTYANGVYKRLTRLLATPDMATVAATTHSRANTSVNSTVAAHPMAVWEAQP